jgi:micrococcal nuclease
MRRLCRFLGALMNLKARIDGAGDIMLALAKLLLKVALVAACVAGFIWGISTVAKADAIRVIDGDTIAVTKDATPGILGFGAKPGEQFSCRIHGIDTPELRGKCDKEKQLATKARLRVMNILSVGSVDVRLMKGSDKYGRKLCRVVAGDRDVADSLVAEGLARRYDGKGPRKPWC